MATPTEWYTSLPGVGSVGAPEDRRLLGGGGGVGGRGSPLMSQFQKRRRELQNALAEQQLKLMKEKLKQARGETRDRITDRGDRLLDPFREAEARRNMPRPPRKAPTGQDYGQISKSFFDLYGGVRKPFDVKNMANWLKFIGPGRAHAGMMQTGKLFANQGAGGALLGPPEEKVPVAQGGRPGTRPWQGAPGPSLGEVLGRKEKGGTIPKTGPYELHEGEVVVSADQVDRPLMAALKADKLSKMHSGQMDGKGTGPGPPTSKSMIKDEFRGGTLHSYQGGSLEHEPGFVPWQRSFAEGGMEDFPGAAEGSVLDRIMAYLRADPRGNPQFMERPPGSPEDTSALLAEAIGDASPARPYPQPSFEESSDQYKEDYMRNVTPAGAAGARPMTNYAAGGVDPEAQVMDELLAMGDDPRYQQQERDRLGAAANEATFARAREGDFGSPENPLTLQRGGPTQRTTYEPGDRADPNVKEREKREFAAAMNEMKADRLQDYLAANAGEMDPQTFKSISDQANQLKKINENERDRQTLKDENAKDRIVEMEKVLGDYQGQVARAQATGQASENVGLRQAERDLRGKLERYEFKFLEQVEAGASREVLEAYSEAMFEIKAELEGFSRGDQGYQEAHDAFMNYQMSVLGE